MKVLVVGRARGTQEEVAALKAMTTFDATIVVGSTALDFPDHIDHWVTFHAMLFERWIEKRKRKGYPAAANYWTALYNGYPVAPKLNAKLPIKRVHSQGGSSGLVGVEVALEIGGTRIALAGVPMEAARGKYDDPNTSSTWREAANYHGAWKLALPRLKDKVRSMSGWTLELLGGVPPTKEWLEE